MQILIDIPDAPIKDYQDLFYKIYGMAASEGLFDDKVKSQRALALKVVLDILDGIVNGTLLPKGHGRLGDLDALETEMVNGIHAGNYEEGYETFAHINNMDDCVDCVRYADTIIEADKAESEGSNEVSNI